MSLHRRRRAIVLVSLATVTFASTALPAGAAPVASVRSVKAASVLPAAVVAPTGLSAQRVPADPNDFLVSWKPVAGVHHYNVSIFYRGEDHVTVVPAGTTSLPIEGVDLRTQYRITVSSRDAAGEGSTSGPVWLHPAVPGAPAKLAVSSSDGGSTIMATWEAPRWGGYTPITGYRVVVTRLADQSVLTDTMVTATTFTIGDLDSDRQHSVKVTAINAQGTSETATYLVIGERPAAPSWVRGERDAAMPTVLHVTWPEVVKPGKEVLTRYELLHGTATASFIITLPPTARAYDLPVAADKSVIFTVRACSDRGCGNPARAVRVRAPETVASTSSEATTSPSVDVADANGVITVRTNGVLGSNVLYPQLVVRVRPTLENGGFTDTQFGQNGAQLMTFRTVPTGTYWATVHGRAVSGAEVEIARKLVIVGDDGIMSAPEWQLIFGKATFSGQVVDMPGPGETRVLSRRPRSSPDLVLSTSATLYSGWGYGVWFRTELDANSKINGYTFQYDPKFGNKFIIRHWYQGVECATPLAGTAFPKGFEPFGVEHRLVLVAQGDKVWASVDGLEVFRLNSLQAAIDASPCAYPKPLGTRIGFRTWSTSPARFVGTTFS
jgi:hypothetical protein